MMPAPRDHTLGIDEGTTGVRAVVLRSDGAISGLAYVEIPQRYPHPGWVEQDPEGIWQATRAVVGRALESARLSASDLAAIGIANQRGSAVLFESDGGPALGPVVCWQDQRTMDRCAELGREGIFASPFTALTKYEWLVRQDAGRTDPARVRVGTIDTWLASRLTGGGAHSTDHSNASVTGLYDWMTGDYEQRPLDVLGLDRAWLPAIGDTSGVIGESTRAAIGGTVPVAALAGDQHAAMYGLACVSPGDVKLSLGTSGMMNLNAGVALAAPGDGTYPLVLWSLDGNRSFCFEGTTVTAGAAAQWLRDGLGLVERLDDLEALARSVDSTAGVWAVPAFQGLGTPYLDTSARATIGGLTRAATRAHVARAVLEGVAWRCREVFDALVQNAPARPTVLRVDGGAAANVLLLEMLADALGLPVEVPAMLDSAAVGAALLAGRAVGLWRDEDVAASWKPGRRIDPRISEDQRGTRFERWRKLVSLVREAGA